VAAELVVSHGVEGFSLREAARQAGVTPTACYRHFPDKAALLTAVANEGFAKLARSMDAGVATVQTLSRADAARRAVSRFKAVGNAYVRFALENPSQFRVMFSPHGAGGGAPVRGVSPVSGKDPYEIFVEALDGLVEGGVISAKSRVNAELSAWAAIHGLAALLVDGLIPVTKKTDMTAMVGKVTDNVLIGLGSRMRGTRRRRVKSKKIAGAGV